MEQGGVERNGTGRGGEKWDRNGRECKRRPTTPDVTLIPSAIIECRQRGPRVTFDGEAGDVTWPDVEGCSSPLAGRLVNVNTISLQWQFPRANVPPSHRTAPLLSVRSGIRSKAQFYCCSRKVWPPSVQSSKHKRLIRMQTRYSLRRGLDTLSKLEET
ncbi:hypothetical protein Pcinc_039393 [Petrolisthes cinctipes]|uniref:Uncharacterized protein n=1 Tax=Petrolisthes cinctipes TaxID=88211 RepID=A0AAE1BRQ2_PETCI|nr:hypothetical protein Pcinc_039393 [Petrolisthes cinctipes]